jgi:hypothetical protein
MNLPPLGPDVWEDTRLLLPSRDGARSYTNIFTGGSFDVKKIDPDDSEFAGIDLSQLLAEFPVGLYLGS